MLEISNQKRNLKALRKKYSDSLKLVTEARNQMIDAELALEDATREAVKALKDYNDAKRKS